MPDTTSAEVDPAGVEVDLAEKVLSPTVDLTIELDPKVKPWQRPDDLARCGFGDRKTVYKAIQDGQIPYTRIGRKLLVPTWWVRRQLQLDEPEAS